MMSPSLSRYSRAHQMSVTLSASSTVPLSTTLRIALSFSYSSSTPFMSTI